MTHTLQHRGPSKIKQTEEVRGKRLHVVRMCFYEVS
jgi:hypothetical protein